MIQNLQFRGLTAQKEAFLRKMQSFSHLGGWLQPLPMVHGSCSTD
nr:MAG TPA: hypothetical protein [Caudoviricetes sp.]